MTTCRAKEIQELIQIQSVDLDIASLFNDIIK